MAYNRLDLQVSQAVLFAVKFYDKDDFLIVMDQFDDVSVFDKAIKPKNVEFYQLKTNDVSISFSTIISEKWLAKLYKQKERKFNVTQLVLMTNCALQDGTTKFTKDEINFEKLNKDLKKRIVDHLHKELGIPQKDIDVSNMFHMRTKLSLMDHKNQAEKEITDFLGKMYPNIKVETAKCVSNSLVSLLSERQSYEKISSDADFKKIREKKGVSKKDFNDIIERTLLKSLPDFMILNKYVAFPDAKEACYEHAQLQLDLMGNDQYLNNMVNKIVKKMNLTPKKKNENFLSYAKRLFTKLDSNPAYSETYQLVLICALAFNRESDSL